MENTTVINKDKGGKIERAIKRRFPFASQNAVSLLMVELKGLIDPVMYDLNTQVEEWEREAGRARDAAGCARSEVEDREEDIERMEYEAIRQKMLKQFYSY